MDAGTPLNVAAPVKPLAGGRRLSAAQMYDRFVAGDPACNGRFFTGVLTTGIYCLPSCRARKPRRENVRFFPTCEAAREAGFRPCRKCHPDDFARGADPVLETIEDLVAQVRRDPGAFSDGRAVVRRSGFGATRLFELLRQHYHTTPHDLLVRARLAAAKRALLTTDAPLADIALEVGFESLSGFHAQFRRNTGLGPAAYRELRDATRFAIELPRGYALGYLRRALSRDPHSLTERLTGDHYETVIRPGDAPVKLDVKLGPDAVEVTCSSGEVAAAAHEVVAGMLGLEQDVAGFVRAVRKLGLARLVAEREGLRISLTPGVYDGLLWSIIGQQINFPFACLLRRRLTERAGEPFADGLYAPPTAGAVAALEEEELLPLQFSRQKAGYVIAISRLVARGELDLEALRHGSATRAERTLLGVRGLGPWSVNYLLMRALGFADCVPLGDTGVTSGLQVLFALEERPDIDATRRLMSVFSPYRSLATAHLWQLQQPLP